MPACLYGLWPLWASIAPQPFNFELIERVQSELFECFRKTPLIINLRRSNFHIHGLYIGYTKTYSLFGDIYVYRNPMYGT